MADTQSKELRVRENQEVTSPAEQTTPGLVFTPAVDIFETEKEIILLADMPGVKAEIGERRSKIALWELKKIKGIYGISIQAVMARARHLGIISDHTYRNFCITVNSQGWKINEPGEYLGKEHANRFDQLVYRAAAEEIITFSRAAELLNLPLSEFRRAFQIVS